MRKTKLPTLLLALMLCLTLLAAPVSADSGEGDALPNNVNTSWADDESDEETGGVEVMETGEIVEYLPSGKPLTPEGNLTLVDDINDSSGKSKQFLTVTTRGGNYFYLIVDRTKNGENTVHFLNQVDESDLLAIIGSEEKAPAVCSCSDKCYPGHVGTSCPVCVVNMSECAGKEPEQPEALGQPAEPEQPQSKSPISPVPTVIALIVVVVGGAVYFLKFRNPKPDAKGSADLDDYDYGDEDEESEDAEE
ncbi:MAG: DUF4366 domain-containing protein [Clostridia bacterium]|nr:DUF4366 domain-containing protein [Clostridia bacterium]